MLKRPYTTCIAIFVHVCMCLFSLFSNFLRKNQYYFFNSWLDNWLSMSINSNKHISGQQEKIMSNRNHLNGNKTNIHTYFCLLLFSSGLCEQFSFLVHKCRLLCFKFWVDIIFINWHFEKVGLAWTVKRP